MPLLLTTLALLSLLAVSLDLLRRSLRGRLVGDHPTCSRCAFDLFNRPPTSTRCPECGSDLSAPGAIRTGTRRRNPAFVLTSLTLLLFALASTVNFTYRLITDARLIPLQPTFLLPLHFRYGPLVAPALAELQSRILTGRASASAASGVISRILSFQADPKAKWNPTHGTFIELLHQSSLLPAADWTAYLEHCATLTARIRPNVRTGDPIPVEIAVTCRVGALVSRTNPRGYIHAVGSGSAVLDDQPPRVPEPWSNPSFNLRPFPPITVRDAISQAMYATLSPGRHIAHLSTELAVGRAGDPPLKICQSFDIPFVLHPADHPTVRVLDDPALRDQVAKSIVVTVVPSMSPQMPLMYALSPPNSPCALSYDVTFRSGTKEYGRSRIALSKGTHNSFAVSPNFPVPSHIPDHIDLILRPNPKHAVTSIDIAEICAGDITLSNLSTTPSRNWTSALRNPPTARP